MLVVAELANRGQLEAFVLADDKSNTRTNEGAQARPKSRRAAMQQLHIAHLYALHAIKWVRESFFRNQHGLGQHSAVDAVIIIVC